MTEEQIGLVGREFLHFKGNLYRLLFVARHSETLEDMVVYQDVNAPEKIWARPANMWEETVETAEGMKLRFEYLGEEMNKA
jgi:hypothetical protein